MRAAARQPFFSPPHACFSGRDHEKALLAATATTDASGAYTLSGLGAGTYSVYVSSADSLEKAVTTSVAVTAGKDASAAEAMNLSPLGSSPLTGTVSGIVSLDVATPAYSSISPAARGSP